MEDNNFKILLVEDNEEQANPIIEILEDNSYETTHVVNGKTAIDSIKSEIYDLILLDIGLPDKLDGFGVCEEIKQIPNRQDIPIIFITGKDDKESVEKGFEVGGVDYLTKPIRAIEILSSVKTHIELKNKTEGLRTIIFKLENHIGKLSFFNEQNKERLKGIIEPYKVPPPGVILFTHGFGGSIERWNKMIDLIKDNKELYVPYDIQKFPYPTTFFNWKIFRKFPDINIISRALKTYIKARCSNYSTIIIVAHSMGGLVARKYLINEIDEIKKNGIEKEIKLLLFATPNKGAQLANFSRRIQIRNRIVKQMSKGGKFIEALNEDWLRLQITNYFDVMYIRADGDNIVGYDSPLGLFDKIETDNNKNHFTIGKPENHKDTSYILLKKFALNLD